MKPLGAWDYVIVGAGTAGCVLANRLSADPDVTVLLLEAGGKDDWIWIHIPVGYLYCIGNPRTDWCYRTEPDPGLNGRSILYARGKVLGGCSSINAMLYLRGQRRDYDEWARIAGDSAWSWSSVLPVFKRSEDHHGGASDMHSAGGEWRVERQRLSWDVLDSFREAMAQAGIPKVEDFNGGDNEGAAFFEVNQRRGVRWSAAKGFLKPAMSRPNLTVMTDVHVNRIRLDGRRAAGVELRRGGEDVFAEGRIETILAAGRDRLAADPSALRNRAGGAAAGARHPGRARSAGRRGEPPGPPPAPHGVQGEERRDDEPACRSLWGKAAMGLEYAFRRTGPLTMAPSQLGGFAKSDPSQPTANVEYHVQPLSLDKFGDPLHPFSAITASVCNLRPTSRGYVRIKSADARAHPAINPRYLSTPEDRKIAADALRLTRRIASQPALARYEPQEFKPGIELQTDAPACEGRGRRRHHDLPPGRNLQDEPGFRSWRRSSIRACTCTASNACASSMPRSCRRSPPATPTRRR